MIADPLATISVGVRAFSRQLRELIEAAEAGSPPLLITRHDRAVALLVAFDVGRRHTPPASLPTHVAMTPLMGKLSEVLKMVEHDRQAVVITRHRRPRAMLVPAEGLLFDEHRRRSQEQLTELLRSLENGTR